MTHFLGELTHIDDKCGAWIVTLPIQGTEIDFKIDTGADISVISEKTFSLLKYKPQLKRVNVKLESQGVHCTAEDNSKPRLSLKISSTVLKHLL